MLPIVVRGLHQSLDEVVGVGLDGELASRIEAARGEIDLSHDRTRLVR